MDLALDLTRPAVLAPRLAATRTENSRRQALARCQPKELLDDELPVPITPLAKALAEATTAFLQTTTTAPLAHHGAPEPMSQSDSSYSGFPTHLGTGAIRPRGGRRPLPGEPPSPPEDDWLTKSAAPGRPGQRQGGANKLQLARTDSGHWNTAHPDGPYDHWYWHHHVHPGDLVTFQRPDQVTPGRGVVTKSKGRDGGYVYDDTGQLHQVHHRHVYEHTPAVRPGDATQSDALLALHATGLPLATDTLTPHDRVAAVDSLRRMALPLAQDVVTDAHPHRQDALDALARSGLPIEPHGFARTAPRQQAPLPPEQLAALGEAIAQGYPLDEARFAQLSPADRERTLRRIFGTAADSNQERPLVR